MNKVSTTFTKMEINRTIIKDAVFLYSLLIEERDFSIVFERLQQFPLTNRRRQRCLLLLSKITDKRQLRFADAITRLESLIRGLMDLLFKDISLIKTKTNCALAETKIEKAGQIYKISLSCRKDTIQCDLEKFMEENSDNLIKISTHQDLDSDLSILLKDVVNDFSIARGRNCQKLGDTIICLESPDHYTIYSTNTKDFAPICLALQKKFAEIKQ